MPRIKTKVSEPIMRAQAEQAVNDIAAAMNRQREIQSEIDRRKLDIDQDHASLLGEIGDTIEAATAQVQQWAEANPAEFQKRKSVEFPGGTVGFRTGTPAVKTLRKTRENAIIEALRGIKRLCGYILTKEAVAKDKILADYAGGILSDGDLALAGLRVVQAETFFVDPNLTAPETRISQPA